MKNASLAKWERALRRLEQRVAQAADEGVHVAATELASRSEANAPKDEGELARSIKVVKVHGSRHGTVVYEVVATARHALPVEFGRRTGRGFVPPRPFMRRARNQLKRRVNRIIARPIARAIKTA